MPAPFRISKSKFVAGVQCLKRLYFQVHHPEFVEEADAGQQARIDQGTEVGLLAQKKFPGGVLAGFEEGAEDAVASTAALMKGPSVPAIFEATFQHSNLLVRVDILERRRGGRWRLIEVKSSVDLKPHYLYDIGIQYQVLRACGLDISSACVMHLNREYRFDGKRLDLAKLFAIEDLTRRVRKLDSDLPGLLRAQQKALAQAVPPNVAPGLQCRDPYACEFYSRCNPEPPENHVTFLPPLSDKKRRELEELGIGLISEIPDDFPLTELQARMRECVISGRPWVSDSLSGELASLRYPLFFMDFESFNPAIPRFRGMRPYSQIPFQWSIHLRAGPQARLEHFKFLAEDCDDPRQEFMESLCRVLGKRGSIVVYNAGFESQRLMEVAECFPEYTQRVKNIRARLWDLLPFIREHVYHPEFRVRFPSRRYCRRWRLG